MTTQIFEAIGSQLIMLTAIYVLVLVVIFLDLWAGIRKAKQRGEFRSSYGFRKTVDKIGKYLNMMLVITVIDSFQMLAISQLNSQADGGDIPVIPILTFAGAMFVGFIELKSIYEKNEDKEKAKMQEAANLAAQILRHSDTKEALAALAEFGRRPQEDKPIKTVEEWPE